jgi:hypothetical protein
MRLTWRNLRNFKDRGLGYGQPSRRMNAHSRIFNDQDLAVST